MFNRFLDTLKMYCQYFNMFYDSVKNPESNLPKSIYPAFSKCLTEGLQNEAFEKKTRRDMKLANADPL